MDWIELLKQVFDVCIIPLLGVATVFLVALIKKKSAEVAAKTDNEIAAKYITMVGDTISACVTATNQVYVNSLKETGAFTVEAQKEAFQKTLSAVLSLLSDEAKTYIQTAYGDLNTYLTTQIEAVVNEKRA